MPLIEPRVNRLGFVVNLARRRDARISVKEPTPARNEYQVTIATGSRERAASLAYLLMMHQAMSCLLYTSDAADE